MRFQHLSVHCTFISKLYCMLKLYLYQRIIRALYLLRDATGRNVLHVAASCGHLDLVVWLLKKKGRIKVDLTDLESRWTALHRTAYLGYAGILAVLHRSGGNLEQLDYDKFSPLNILQYNMDTIRNTPCKRYTTYCTLPSSIHVHCMYTYTYTCMYISVTHLYLPQYAHVQVHVHMCILDCMCMSMFMELEAIKYLQYV